MKQFRLAVLFLILLGALFLIGYPLKPDSPSLTNTQASSSFSQRCFSLGDFTSLLSCLGQPGVRLHSLTLLVTIADRLSMVSLIFPFIFYIVLVGFVLFTLLALSKGWVSWLFIALPLLAWLLTFILTPPLQTPDEPSHYLYVESIAHDHYPLLPHDGLVEISPDVANLEQTVHFNEVAHHQDQLATIETIQPVALPPSATLSGQAYHPPLYYLTASLFYRLGSLLHFSTLGRFYLTRLTSLIFYLIFLAACWLTAKQLFGPTIAKPLTAALGLQPTLLMTAVSVNPEIAVITLSAVTFYILLQAIREHFPLSRLIMLALLTILTLYTKVTAVILVPTVLAALFLFDSHSLIIKLRSVLVYSTLTFIGWLPWLVWNKMHYQTLLPTNFDLVLAKADFPAVISKTMFLSRLFDDAYVSLLHIPGVLGWLDAPAWYELRLLVMVVVLIVTVIGGWAAWTRKSVTLHQTQPLQAASLFVLLSGLFLLALDWQFKVHYWTNGLQGRYYLVALLPASILFYHGLLSVLRLKEETAAQLMFIGNLMIFILVTWFALVPRYYI